MNRTQPAAVIAAQQKLLKVAQIQSVSSKISEKNLYQKLRLKISKKKSEKNLWLKKIEKKI